MDAPIGRHPVDRKKMAVVANGRPAVTHWAVRLGVPGLHLCALPSRDRAHPPDPGPYGEDRPPHSGGYRVWGEEARPRPPGPVPSRGWAAVRPPPDGEMVGTLLPAAGGISGGPPQAGRKTVIEGGPRPGSQGGGFIYTAKTAEWGRGLGQFPLPRGRQTMRWLGRHNGPAPPG